MRFIEWMNLEPVCIEAFIAEAINLKQNLPTNNQEMLQRLDIEVRKQAKLNGSPVNNQVIVHTIRHQFTNYDKEWPQAERLKGKPGYAQAWNNLCKSAANQVAQFIMTYLSPQQQKDLLAINKVWLQNHTITVATREEDDDDPLQYRNFGRRIGSM